MDEILNSINTYCFTDYKFHPQQCGMVKEIITAYTKGDKNKYAILLAQMQSGKSGTYLLLSLLMVYLNIVNNVYIICGSRDLELYKQTKKNKENAIEQFSKILRNHLIKFAVEVASENGSDIMFAISSANTQCDTIILACSKNIKVVFNQNLYKKISSIDPKTLIINDESHYAQAKKNVPYNKFWKRFGLHKCLYGDMSVLDDKDIYILNVSATPIAELTQDERIRLDISEESELIEIENELNENVSLRKKKVHVMEPGDGYMGVRDFKEKNMIKYIERRDINFENFARTIDNTKYNNKYLLIRLSNKKDEAILRIAEQLDYDYINLFQGSEISFDIFETSPVKTTIIAICGKGRMGQDFSKEHIGLVYEPSMNVKTDTCLQALLGRMCGYHNNTEIDIYVSSKSKDEIDKYANGDIFDIKKANHVKANNKKLRGDLCMDKDNNLWKMIIPIKIPYCVLEGFGGGSIDTIGDIKRNLNLIENYIRDSVGLVGDDEIEYICRNLTRIITQYSDLTKKTYRLQNSFHKLEEAGRLKRREYGDFSGTSNISNYHNQNVESLVIPYDDTQKVLFILGFTPVMSNNLEKEMIRYSISDIDEKANYKWQEDEVVVEVTEQMGQMICFPEETANIKSVFEKELKEAIERTQSQDPLFVGRINKSIKSNSHRGYIILDFTEAEIKRILCKLERDLGVKIKLDKKRGRKPKDGFPPTSMRYTIIQW